MPYFNYCGTVWGNIGIGLANKIQKLQNRAARIFTFSNYEIRPSVLFHELGWERLEIYRWKQLAVCMYKVHNNLSPSYLRRIFTNTANVHAYNLEQSLKKGAHSIEDLFCLKRISPVLRTQPTLRNFKTLFKGKDTYV